jgi:hypothetical protein
VNGGERLGLRSVLVRAQLCAAVWKQTSFVWVICRNAELDMSLMMRNEQQVDDDKERCERDEMTGELSLWQSTLCE